jgi:oxygen-independent coproporphyrinogen-3 oxidase
MPAAPLQRLLHGLGARDALEVTAETNPEDADDAWLDGARAAGATRISLGVQTFDPRFARLLNRACTVASARATARRVASAGFASFSIDVMFALPGQTVAAFADDLDRLLDTGAPHVSLYGLTFEPGTPLFRARNAGRLTETDDDAWREMYDLAVDRLGAAGLARYEVSNFAAEGHRSVHNRLYWTDAPYLGLGPSAHGYAPDGTRWIDTTDVQRYLAGGDPTATSERPAPRAAAVDLVLSMLRGVEGVDRTRLRARCAHDLDAAVVSELERDGLVVASRDRVALAHAGFPLADLATERLAAALVPILATE